MCIVRTDWPGSCFPSPCNRCLSIPLSSFKAIPKDNRKALGIQGLPQVEQGEVSEERRVWSWSSSRRCNKKPAIFSPCGTPSIIDQRKSAANFEFRMDSSGTSFDEMGVSSPSNKAAKTNASVKDEGPRETRIEGMEALDSVANDEVRANITAEELSFYSASENDHGDDSLWGLLSGAGGNIYEW